MRLFIALAALLVVVNTADARPRHYKRHVQVSHDVITCDRLGCSDRVLYQGEPRTIRSSERRRTANLSARRHQDVDRSEEPRAQAMGGDLISRARAYIGMTAAQIGLKRRTLWCAAFLRHLGISGVDDRAISFAKLPRTGRCVGCLAVYPHHVGIVTGFKDGYPILLSGNSNGRRVYEGVYRRRPIAYVAGG
jgi:hypothetical protein